MTKRALLLSALLSVPAYANTCDDSAQMVQVGQSGLGSYEAGKAMAKQLCGRIASEPSPDPALLSQCNQLGVIDANPRLQDENVQEALGRFEQTFGIPREQFLHALADGRMRELMAGHGITNAALEVAFDKNAMSANMAAATASATSTASSLSETEERSPSSRKGLGLRDALRAKLNEKPTKGSKGGPDQTAGAGGSASSAENAGTGPEAESLTIFDVVHRRYQLLSPRLHTGASLTPSP